MKKLLFLLISLSLFNYSANAESLQARFSGLDTLSAKFSQKLFDAEQTLQEESNGTLKIKRPNQFNLVYEEPYQQFYVADGTTLSFYDKDLEQVTLKPQKGLLENTPAMILSNPGQLDKVYVVKPRADAEGLSWYELTPKKTGGSFEQLSLGFDGKDLKVMEMLDNFGQTTRLEFSQIRRNPDLDPKLFRFTPPAGVDVIYQ